MTDAEVIEAIRRGERDAFAVLVERYQRLVEGVAYCACGQRALVDDIVQDTFLTAWRTIDRLRDASRARAWLASIARNVGRNARRRSKTRRETSLVDVAVSTATDGERDVEIAAALERLPMRYREPIVLFYYEHCTVKEVADALALREDAVMQRLSRGRRRLGEALATRVEISLESKKSRAALAAVLLALLPARSVAAAPAPSIVWTWLAAHWRIPAAIVACAIAGIGLLAAVERSNAIAAHAAASTAPPSTPPQRTAPKLPEQAKREWHRNLVVASPDPAESCARATRAMVISVLDPHAYRKVGDKAYWEPSAFAVQTADRIAAKVASDCAGPAWPELYVMCEATTFELLDANVTCYPYDPFAT